MWQTIKQIREKIQHQSPLILNLTNNVTMDFIANGLLSLGASPVMSESLEDTIELMHLANAMTINMGTINKEWLDRIFEICEYSKTQAPLIVFDPVGAGATKYRTTYALKILETGIVNIIRGNASEIMALDNTSHKTHGVNSTEDTLSALESAKSLAQQYNATIVVSGKTDLIVSPNNLKTLTGGSKFMPMITGTGCLLTAVVAAFGAVHDDLFEAAYSACAFYSNCGSIADQYASGPGTFKTHFIDALYA
jgi:hydroxyethylthiazole kinase